MSDCCDSKTTKKFPKQGLSQESKGNGWFDKTKAAFGFGAKSVLNSKNNAARQQNHQKSCCG